MDLIKELRDALNYLPDIREEKIFLIVPFEEIFELLEGRKTREASELLRDSGFRDALRTTPKPGIPDRIISHRARRFFRILGRIVERGQRDFKQYDLAFVGSIIRSWLRISENRLSSASY